jgi:hypothetical protein
MPLKRIGQVCLNITHMSRRKSLAASSSPRTGFKPSIAILGLNDHLYYKRGRKMISRAGVELSGSCRKEGEDVVKRCSELKNL